MARPQIYRKKRPKIFLSWFYGVIIDISVVISDIVSKKIIFFEIVKEVFIVNFKRKWLFH